MAAGVATIAFSLVVSIAPAMAAKGGNADGNSGNGNAGVVKIHDATTDLEAGEHGERAVGLRLLGRLLRLRTRPRPEPGRS